MSRALLLLAAVVASIGCTNVSTVRAGSPAPPRPLDCSLELVDITPGQTPPGTELVGYVRVTHDAGKNPNDPEILKMVKPEACKLGGEIVSSMMSANVTNGFRDNSVLSFAVWHKKGSGPSKPTKF